MPAVYDLQPFKVVTRTVFQAEKEREREGGRLIKRAQHIPSPSRSLSLSLHTQSPLQSFDTDSVITCAYRTHTHTHTLLLTRPTLRALVESCMADPSFLQTTFAFQISSFITLFSISSSSTLIILNI